MLVNRTWRRKKLLELAIWEDYRRKSGLMHVDIHTYCNNFIQYQWTFSSSKAVFPQLKKTSPSRFIWNEDVFSHLE